MIHQLLNKPSLIGNLSCYPIETNNAIKPPQNINFFLALLFFHPRRQ